MNAIVDPKVLVRLLRMQGKLLRLSDAELAPFVIRELSQVPGVGHIEYAAAERPSRLTPIMWATACPC